MGGRQTRIEWIAGWVAYARWLLARSMARCAERATVAVAWRLPRYLVYWAAIRLGAHATVGTYGETEPDAMSFMEALRRWETPNDRR